MTNIRIKPAFLVGICVGCLYFCSNYETIVSKSNISIYKDVSTSTKFNASEHQTIQNEKQTHIKKHFKNNALPNSLNENKVEDRTFAKLMDSIQTGRQQQLSKTCKFLSNLSHATPNVMFLENNVLYSKAYQLTVCHIKKCGFSSWIRSMLVMDGFYPDLKTLQSAVKDGTANLMDLSWKFSLNHKHQVESRRNWEKSFKVILVRHPFARLVSAYYDKMVPRPGSSDYYKKISRTVNQQYRHLRGNLTMRNESDDGTSSFEDFVNFLVSEKQYDGHWRLFDKTCHPCMYKFDYIAKFETLSDDIKYLNEKLNISVDHRKAIFPQRHFNYDEEKTRKEFKTIPRTLKNKLYRMYRNDFELFGYERLL